MIWQRLAIVGLLMVCSFSLIGQNQATTNEGPGLQIPPYANPPSIGSKLLLSNTSLNLIPSLDLKASSALSFGQPKSLPNIYKIEDLALFCRWEALLEKSAKIPVKVRLGDVDTVDRLEGKPHVRY